jgi:outer membrane protein OmpA-like peptidoglycan-associated protein
VAGSFLVPGKDLKLISEIYGSIPAHNAGETSDRSQYTLEWLTGAKSDVSRSVALHFGGGTRFAKGTASPEWRLYAGLNYVLGLGDPKQPLIEKVDSTGETAQYDPFGDVAPDDVETFRASEIFFGFDSARLASDGSRETLKQLAEYLQKPPIYQMLVIEGHTDSIGSAEYNRDLSQRRAENIREYLVEKLNLRASKVRALGFGENQPIADNGNFQGRQRNRRVEFRIYRNKDAIPFDLR